MSYTLHEPIGRTIQLVAPMRVEDVVLLPMDGYPEIVTFRCSPLCADIQPSACKSNYLSQKSVSCRGCEVGAKHAGVEVHRTAIDVLNDPNSDRHARAAAANGLNCVRCLRSGSTAKRFIGRFRLVQKAWCISCYNRTREVHSGKNSKLAKPVKWAGLRQTVITIEDATGTWTTLEPIMTTGRAEAERYVARCHPGCVLVEVFMGGHAVQPSDPDPTPADWKADAIRKGNATTKRKPLPVASDREAFSDVDDCWPSRNAVEVEPVESALDPESIAAFWDLTADSLPEFVQWLCDDWPTFKRAPEWEPSATDKAILNRGLSDHLVDCAVYGHPKRQAGAAAPSSPVADAVALPEVSDAVVSDSEQPENESEWAGCYIVRDGVTTYVTDYAEQRGISDEEAAIVLGMCDPDYSDEPEAAAAPELEPAAEPVKAEPAPIPKKLTGKQLRKLEKAQRRLERSQQQPAAPAKPTLISSPKAIAITARAMVQVAFELNGIR